MPTVPAIGADVFWWHLTLVIIAAVMVLVVVTLAGCCTTQPNDRSMANMPFDKLIKELSKPI